MWIICWAVAAGLLLVLLAVWQGRAFVEYSDGVYAASARIVKDGLVPYRDFAAAQPPSLYYLGALLLSLGDSVEALRHCLALADLALGLLVLALVWQLTELRSAAFIAGLLALVTPWALLEHAQFIPETFAAPLLAGAMLCAATRRWSLLGGVLGALAATFKLAFLVPAGAIVIAAAAPLPALAGLAAMSLAALVVSAVGFGSAIWDSAIQAQREAGLASVHYVGGLWTQAAWNLLPLLVPAALTIRWRAQAARPHLLRVVIATAAASLLLLLTLFKDGSYLNVLVVAEPPLLVLAACGWSWLLERRSVPALAASSLALLVGVAQVVSLVAHPLDPKLFGRPRAASAPGWRLDSSGVRDAQERAARCPPASAYSGPPYLAFAARRRLPGDQPDQFIIHASARNARFLARADHDAERCP